MEFAGFVNSGGGCAILSTMFGAKKFPHRSLGYFVSNISVVLGVVLIWRGIWYVLDKLDAVFFDGNHLPIALGGIVLGILILYIPDHDLKELGKL